MRKRVQAFLVVIAVFLTITACGNQPEDLPVDANSSSIAEESEAGSSTEDAVTREVVPSPTDFLTEEDMKVASPWKVCNNSALAAAMKKAEAGEPITIATIGGSITQGTISNGTKDSEVKSKSPYADIFFSWWKETFPNSEVSVVNAGIGATDSYLGVHRVQEDVLSFHPDVVLIEYSVNDNGDNTYKVTYDNLVYKVATSEDAPAVMLLFMGQTNLASAQGVHQLIGFNYELPMVSYLNLMSDMLEAGRYTEKDLSGDVTHPSALGHAIVGEILWKYLNNVYVQLDSFEEPVEFDKEIFTKDKYLDAELVGVGDLTPESMGSFTESNKDFNGWGSVWKTTEGEESITFKASFKNLGILFWRSTSSTYGKYEVWVDGEHKATLQGDFPGGWGNYAHSQEVYASNEEAEHVVEIKKAADSKGDDFALLRLMISHGEVKSSDVWVMDEAPIIRNSLSEEDKLARQNAILGKGTSLFSGKTNEGYYPGDISWLTGAGENDLLALVYACDDVTHGGWGVLGMSVKATGINSKQLDIAAYSDEPQKERLVVYSMEELLAIAKGDKILDINSFSLGAWNGGRIAGLYYLPESVASELQTFLKEVEETEQIIHTYKGELSNENAIENAKIVYSYLQEVYKDVCLTGQMESTWMGSPDYELNYIEKATGKLPAIRGLDFMHNDFAGVAKRAKEWWEKGGIPTICWHTGADFASGYNESKDDNLNWDEAFIPGSETYNKLLEDMDRAVPYLQQLEDANVPVLWRPFHELDGGWFWWSKGGAENFVKLWQLMYSRYTDYWGLDNLIWVLGYSGNGGNMAAWYPGDSYVDLLGADSYTAGANVHLFEECEALAPEGMPIVFHECGTIPTQEQMDEGAPWSFFMVWHTDYITDEHNNSKTSLNEIYNSEYFITLDELPFKK